LQLKICNSSLRDDALAIWHAGLDAVRSKRLIRQAVRVQGRQLLAGDEKIPLDQVRRIAVVGAGKAGAGMAAAIEEVLGPELAAQKHLAGWVNVPADCVSGLSQFSSDENGTVPLPLPRRIRLHAARPAGLNEPTAEGVAGADEILRLVGGLASDNLCLALVSGGGSALLPAPADGVTLDDKLAVTRHLSAAGASIEELNTVRKHLSRIKGGGLARACRAGRLLTLIISDVLGDPLDLIASGPTVEDRSSPADALAVLEKYAAGPGISPRVFECLLRRRVSPAAATCRVTNLVIGNNATAVDAAGSEASRRGYACATISAPHSEGPAEEVGRCLAETALAMRAGPGPNCLVSGGEPVVRLVEKSRRGLGGRNQQLALAALERLAGDGAGGIALLSAGTDGEDGPTDAAGAIVDAAVVRAARCRGLAPADFLARNDAYHFFEPIDGLVKTGPTHTNVCDVRVLVVDRDA
jgi:hydroxypyruvate reductase